MKNVKIIMIMLLLSIAVTISHAGQMNKFVFTQLKYSGNWDPYPETWQDIIEFIVTATTIKPEPQRRIIEIDDPQLFASPILFILGAEQFPALSPAQRGILRKYLENGGMVFAEDSSGLRGGVFDTAFRNEIMKVFPEYKLKKLPINHPLMRAYYLLRGVSGRRLTNNYLEGIDISGRTALIYSQNDIVGSWAKDRFGNYIWECNPGGQAQRFESQKLTLNMIMYSVTGTYKSDAIHQPFLEEKMRR